MAWVNTRHCEWLSLIRPSRSVVGTCMWTEGKEIGSEWRWLEDQSRERLVVAQDPSIRIILSNAIYAALEKVEAAQLRDEVLLDIERRAITRESKSDRGRNGYIFIKASTEIQPSSACLTPSPQRLQPLRPISAAMGT